MSAERIVLLGAGGHARVLLDALRAGGAEVVGYVAPSDESRLGDVPWLGRDEVLSGLPAGVVVVNGVGSAGDTSGRRAAHAAAVAAGLEFRSVVHPAATVLNSAHLAPGAQVLAGAIVGEHARIGTGAIINSGAIVDHDGVVGSNAHVATGATLAGDVTIGDGSHIGLGARVMQGVTIGSSCIVGAGAVVLADVPDGSLAVGIPATIRPRTRTDEDGS